MINYYDFCSPTMTKRVSYKQIERKNHVKYPVLTPPALMVQEWLHTANFTWLDMAANLLSLPGPDHLHRQAQQ
jgi:hypothetical protein